MPKLQRTMKQLGGVTGSLKKQPNHFSSIGGGGGEVGKSSQKSIDFEEIEYHTSQKQFQKENETIEHNF